jgi:hypothetical protein
MFSPEEATPMKLQLSTGAALLFVLLASLTVRTELSREERDSATIGEP